MKARFFMIALFVLNIFQMSAHMVRLYQQIRQY